MTNSAASDQEPVFIEVGEVNGQRRIAVRAREGAVPGLFWLGGFNSDMKGTKAEALSAFAAATGRAFLRFDYSGHGESDGDFEAGTISRWAEEAAAMVALAGERPVLVGSSMGGWIASTLVRLGDLTFEFLPPEDAQS